MKLNIAILAGDGIGPEVMQQALKVLTSISKKNNHKLVQTEALVGACAIEKTGDPYPDETHEICMNSDAVLFGAIGDPKFDNDPGAKVRPEQGLLAMRKKLELYANVRPVETFDALIDRSPLKNDRIQGVDFMCLRELTGGIYFGEKGRKNNGKTAFDICSYSDYEVERILRLGYAMAQKRNKKLTVVDKANVLESSRLWREIAQTLEKEYTDVETEYLFVDAAAMRIIQWPSGFDVLVTSNMFGDILTDEASVITGSMGLMPSASIGTHTSVFEPIHGSYPQATGKNIANPLGMILSLAMMLESAFGLKEEANSIRRAVDKSISEGYVTEDLAKNGKSYFTSEVGDWLSQYLA